MKPQNTRKDIGQQAFEVDGPSNTFSDSIMQRIEAEKALEQVPVAVASSPQKKWREVLVPTGILLFLAIAFFFSSSVEEMPQSVTSLQDYLKGFSLDIPSKVSPLYALALIGILFMMTVDRFIGSWSAGRRP